MNTSLLCALLGFSLVLVGLGCSSDTVNPCAKSPLPVENYTWQLTDIAWMPTVPTTDDSQLPSFHLDSTNRTISANTGVNQLNGEYKLAGGELRFTPLASTRKAGPVPLVDQEREFDAVMGDTAYWRYFGDNEIDLLDAGGMKLARFTRGAATDMK